jgi:DNA-binding NarL/FixJ family response regulator
LAIAMTMLTASRPATQVLLLDEGYAEGFDSVAASVAIFGRGRLELLAAPDLGALRQMAGELTALGAPAVIVVVVDHDPEPKSILAEAADLGLPLAVLTEGRSDAIHDHALSVGAAAYLLRPLPARELVDRLEALSALR